MKALRVLQGSFKGLSRKIEGCCDGVLMVSIVFKKKLNGCLLEVSKVFQ